MRASITSVVIFQIICHTIGVSAFFARVCQDTFGNYTTSSTFKNNLNTFFSIIANDTKINYGFYNLSVGQGVDTVNGLGLCRPDISFDNCHQCLKDGAAEIVFRCPAQKDAIGWHDQCMIRYSDRYIFGKLEFGPWFYTFTPQVYVGKKRYNQTVASLLTKLKKEAAYGDYRYKFSFGKVNFSKLQVSVYALVQCTPDLEKYDCYTCLDQAIDYALIHGYGRKGRVFYCSCNIRYETYPFYNQTSLNALRRSLSSPPPLLDFNSQNGEGRRKASKSKILLFTLIPLVTSLAIVASLFGYCFCRRRKGATKPCRELEAEFQIRTPESLQMDFATINDATDNFSDANKLGEGGFGAVYKGTLPNGQAIAVKRLSQNSAQGEDEFKNEALLVARLQHRNLVRFIGFCLEDEERLLIYELLPNKSLDCFLFDPIKRVHLDWQTRYKIIGGIARGLVYLHEDSQLLVVHRDLKASNILLDAKMNPKISDFGLARPFAGNQTQANTSKICGTYGYMPPEYAIQGQFSFKSDVFSFGVLLLEIITGRRTYSFDKSGIGESLLGFAWKNWLEGSAQNVVDPTMSTYDTTEALRCINIGLLCVQEDISHRPTMSSIVLMLNSNTIAPPFPSRPAFLFDNDDKLGQSPHTSSLPHNNNSPLLVDESMNQITVTELDAR